jgi:hypothetical protein
MKYPKEANPWAENGYQGLGVKNRQSLLMGTRSLFTVMKMLCKYIMMTTAQFCEYTNHNFYTFKKGKFYGM